MSTRVEASDPLSCLALLEKSSLSSFLGKGLFLTSDIELSLAGPPGTGAKNSSTVLKFLKIVGASPGHGSGGKLESYVLRMMRPNTQFNDSELHV